MRRIVPHIDGFNGPTLGNDQAGTWLRGAHTRAKGICGSQDA